MKGGATFKFHRVSTVFLKVRPTINNVLEDITYLSKRVQHGVTCILHSVDFNPLCAQLSRKTVTLPHQN